MITTDEEIKEYLIFNDPDFKALAEEHESYDKKLRELAGQPHVSQEDHIEEVQLKKQKLLLKDHMTRMIARFREDQVSHQQP